ncbi:hypothetical protein [Gimesia chilikensis]|jgi:hypothetical protein|uniref:hypothetical protein n=1 Tax=Gimesia chilikensis TaxID=2605989 RepID=UPI00118BB2A6|nr:hypothetical protein [Gimesia chilikensis]MCR9231440.1 hypothetical protein [bacterium]QDT85950.1 hypothetical protein MalM14_36220 [Gimesia chilikensis]
MFRNLIDKIKSLADDGSEPFDPATFDDPIALKTDWSPLKGGGANFCTRKLVQASPLRYEFRATAGAICFYLIFFGIGMAALVFSIFQIVSNEKIFVPEILIPGGVGLVFAIIGGTTLYFGTLPVVFDKQHNCFWRGKISDDELIYATANEQLMPFQEIHAIQLIKEYIHSKNSSYHSYEMNLISRDGVRTNVVDHGNLEKIQADAQTLAEFLEVPIWNGI